MRVLRTNLIPGMILEGGAMDRLGRKLIGADTELTEHLLEVLQTARIPIVYVTDTSYDEHRCHPDLPPISRAQKREITGRFRHVDLDGPFARAVFDECLSHARECNAESTKVRE